MKKIVPVVVLVVLTAVAVVYRVDSVNRQDQFKREGIDGIHMREGFPVRTVPVRHGDFEVWRSIPGKVEGSRQAFISTPDPARIARIHNQVGDRITADTPVISLDEDDPKNISRIQLLRSVYEDALRDYQRHEALFQSGGISREVMDKMRLRLQSARTDLDAARATVHLTSPVGGILMSLSIREGERAEPGKTLGVVASLDQVRIVARVSERDAAELQVGQPVRVHLKSGRIHTGRVDRVSLGADLETGLFDLEMALDNPDRELIVGTFVMALVRVLHRKNAFFVDSRCLLRDFDGNYFVYQVEGGRAAGRVVQKIAENDDYSMITGMDPDRPVVISGKSLLRDGVLLRILNEEAVIYKDEK